MRITLLSIVAALALTASNASAQVRVTMNGGQVSIAAKNATAAQILAEWARVGKTRIINGERLTGPPLTIELSSVPELQALDILLRNASGYVIAPRAAADAGMSTFDRILIVPTSNAPRAVVPTQPPASFSQIRPAAQNDDDEPRPANAPIPRFVAPVNNNEAPEPAPAPPPSSTLTAPAAGVARPGQIVPAPPTPRPQNNQDPR